MNNVKTVTFLFYCYFHGNTATTSGGDVYVHTTNPFTTTTPFESCYSTTSTGKKRCIQPNLGEAVTDLWLSTVEEPLIRVFSSTSDTIWNSYGCGIDIAFPCETVAPPRHKSSRYLINGNSVKGK
jgi:hypothetical protein